MRALSGNHAGWLTTVAKEIREAGKPVSLDFLYRVVPSQFATSTNDGHVTAAENGLDRNDFAAGQRIWVEEAVAALKAAGLAEGTDPFTWAVPQDGSWQVKFGRSKYTIYGRAEALAARDRHMLGDGTAPGYLLKGWSEAEVDVDPGIEGLRKGRHRLEVHPLAFTIPPMTPAEQEAMRADIEAYGVRSPLILYPDAADKTVRGRTKLKVLDGRHRLQFASALNKPVRVELFEGSEEEAKAFVLSLNLYRRHLTSAQQGLIIVSYFGEQAKQEAKEAQIRKPKEGDSVSSKLTEQNGGKSEAGSWEKRALKMAGNAAGVSATNVRAMDVVAQAPLTTAKVMSGEIRTVKQASEEAAKELGKAPPQNLWQDTVRGELGRAHGHLCKVLEELELPPGERKPGEIRELVEEISGTWQKIRIALQERKLL